jgi:hypothetical protein
MKKQTRDIILLRKDMASDEQSIEREVVVLNTLLQTVETLDSLCVAYELIDLNRFKVVHDRTALGKALKPNALKPFQFLFNRN